jgi:hypothetical protein
MDKLSLIRKYEPVLLFSKDDQGREENFFPTSTANYVAESALHRKGEGKIKDRTALSLEDLGRFSSQDSHRLYLAYAADTVLSHDPSLQQRLDHGWLALFSVGGQVTPQLVVEDEAGVAFASADPGLERSRLVADDLDPALSFSAPGAESAAELSFALTDTMQLPDEVHADALERYVPYRDFVRHPPVYYYNVVHNRGYLVLQYWFFYAYNDWGSAHGGVNDHEGDWENVFIYLRDGQPAFVAYSAHTGDPEWHAWADDQVQMQEHTHPVVYVACGSHANYFASQAHPIAAFKDYGYGNSQVAIGPGADIGWGEPADLGVQPWALNYGGGWGALVKRLGTTFLAAGAQAPVGPAWQFARWETPVAWAKIPY